MYFVICSKCGGAEWLRIVTLITEVSKAVWNRGKVRCAMTEEWVVVRPIFTSGLGNSMPTNIDDA